MRSHRRTPGERLRRASRASRAWQTDNEYGCHDTVLSYSHGGAARLSRLVRSANIGSIDALNEAWGNVFWSMEYRRFDEIELPNLTVTEANPSHLMDFQRFSSDQVVAFNRRQTRNHPAPFAGRDRSSTISWARSPTSITTRCRDDLDVAALGQLSARLSRTLRRHDDAFKLRYMRVGDPDFQAFHHDLYRACGRGRWWVMEQQPGPVNWAPWNPAPRRGRRAAVDLRGLRRRRRGGELFPLAAGAFRAGADARSAAAAERRAN